jgi:hypothetical protein
MSARSRICADVSVSARAHARALIAHDAVHAISDVFLNVLIRPTCCARPLQAMSKLLQCISVHVTRHECIRHALYHSILTLLRVLVVCLISHHVTPQYWTSSTTSRCNVIRSTCSIPYTTVLLQCCYCYILPWARCAHSTY